jgi:hypothetical protein
MVLRISDLGLGDSTSIRLLTRVPWTVIRAFVRIENLPRLNKLDKADKCNGFDAEETLLELENTYISEADYEGLWRWL